MHFSLLLVSVAATRYMTESDPFERMARLLVERHGVSWANTNGQERLVLASKTKEVNWWNNFKAMIILAGAEVEGMEPQAAARFGSDMGIASLVINNVDHIRLNLLLDGLLENIPSGLNKAELSYLQLHDAPMWALERLVPQISDFRDLVSVVNKHKTLWDRIADAKKERTDAKQETRGDSTLTVRHAEAYKKRLSQHKQERVSESSPKPLHARVKILGKESQQTIWFWQIVYESGFDLEQLEYIWTGGRKDAKLELGFSKNAANIYTTTSISRKGVTTVTLVVPFYGKKDTLRKALNAKVA